MYCKNCGKQIDPDSKFCFECGTQVDISPEPVSEAPQNETPVDKKISGKKNRGCLPAIIISVVLIVFAIIAGGLKSEQAETGLSMEENKAQALEFDKRAWMDFLTLYKNHNNFMEALGAYSDGKVTDLDFYEYCKKIKESCASASFEYGETKDEKEYLSTFSTFALADQSAAESLIKYIDSGATEDLSKAKGNINRAKEAAIIIAGNRPVFLRKIGLSEEELAKVIESVVTDMEAIDNE